MHSPPKTRESALIVVLIQFRPLDHPAMRFEYPADITGLAEKLARHMDCIVP
jgi:hypothetical protein